MKRKTSWPICGSLLLAVSLFTSVATFAQAPTGSSITFVAENLFSTANGTFHSWRIVSSVLDLEDLSRASVEIEVDLASVDTGIEDRDDHLRDPDFFEVETFPTARVRVHGFEAGGSDEQGRDRYHASFDLDLHGVQKTLVGAFSVISTAPVEIEGSVVVDRLDFGVGQPKSLWNPLSITEEIPVSFRAVLPQ